MDRIHWLFQERGCFLIDGHASYVADWLNKRRFFMVKATIANAEIKVSKSV